MIQLNTEIAMANVEHVNDIITVTDECDTSEGIKNMNSKWIRYYGPS